MEYKQWLLLVAALCLGSVCSQNRKHPPYACQCLMDVQARKRCDSTSAGITAEQCTEKGCCFDATVPDVPWCFKPSGERASLQYAKRMIEPQARVDCGYQGITRKRCKRIGCCFDRKASDASMCFYPPVNEGPPKMCGMAPNKRVGCGYPGISADECLRKGCCFEHYQYVQNVPWCFEPLARQGNFSL
ncbi:putative gastrointestinal growth factor xP4 isoform X2 [Lacerta agilis]|uniref:putative gastrointestinal growth factor xP4 isoform X2 n=1 Tax=Lacerta agilis TaxID=80427 RepID=UPI00141A3837|nr:putative gastrointestinal growth factor xP4 isoform X2 [Lacerta agilis]